MYTFFWWPGHLLTRASCLSVSLSVCHKNLQKFCTLKFRCSISWACSVGTLGESRKERDIFLKIFFFDFDFFRNWKKSLVLLFHVPYMEMKTNVMFTSNGHSFPFHISGPVVDIVPPNAIYGIISWQGATPVAGRSPRHFFQVLCRIEVGTLWWPFQVRRMLGTGSKWGWKFGEGHIPSISVISKINVSYNRLIPSI